LGHFDFSTAILPKRVHKTGHAQTIIFTILIIEGSSETKLKLTPSTPHSTPRIGGGIYGTCSLGTFQRN
jgi:hypothetical protein